MNYLYSGIQRLVLLLSYAVHRPWSRPPARLSWVVGVTEIAGMTERISRALPGSTLVLSTRHPYFSATADISPPSFRVRVLPMLVSILWGPWVLGRLARKHRGIVFVGASGFLSKRRDFREFEFGFLKKHDVRIVCIFTGNDIRSHELASQLAHRTGRPNQSAVSEMANPILVTLEHDRSRQKIAQTADAYADLIYNFEFDQISYLESQTKPFFYAYPDERLNYLPEKFDCDPPFVVVHAPSNPVIKGTAFVREAVERLSSQGYDFEYVELMNVSNDEVLAALKRAHIVLNQFWALAPGVVGIEAMANTCAMLCSADGEIETGLAAGANQAWLQTSTSEVYDNLKRLLDDRELAKTLAIRGFEWVKTTAVASLNSAAFVRDLDSL